MIDCGAAGMANAVYISSPHHMGRSELRPAGVTRAARLARSCHPCLRYDLSPISPGWTNRGWRRCKASDRTRECRVGDAQFQEEISFECQSLRQRRFGGVAHLNEIARMSMATSTGSEILRLLSSNATTTLRVVETMIPSTLR